MKKSIYDSLIDLKKILTVFLLFLNCVNHKSLHMYADRCEQNQAFSNKCIVRIVFCFAINDLTSALNIEKNLALSIFKSSISTSI